MEPLRDDQLAAALQALRPTPRPEFTAELDERAAAGFPRRSRLPRVSLSRLRAVPRRRLLAPAAAFAVLAIALGAGLAARDEPSPSNESGLLNLMAPADSEESVPPAPEETAEESTAAGAERDYGAPLHDFSPPLDLSPPLDRFSKGDRGRAVERSAEIVLGAEPEDVADDAAKVFAAVHANRGIVLVSSVEEGSADDAGASFELLIPSRRLGDALADFSAIDEVRSRQETTADITAPTVTTTELLRESKARIDGLLGQLAEAGTESEREAVEAELRQERRHRSRLRSDLQNLRQRANLSGVSLRIETAPSEDSSTGGPWGIDDALHDAGQVLTVAAAVTLIALAILGPIALIALLAWLTHRAWVRRERRRVLG
jgi:Domain of unknown function (DUF4349)